MVLYGYFKMVADQDLQQALEETAQRDPHWRLADVEADRAVIPEEQNAAVPAMAARQLIPPRWPAWDYADTSDGPDGAAQRTQQELSELEPERQLTPAQVTILREELKKAAAALAEARKLADRPAGRYPITYSPDFIGTLLPDIQNTRTVGNLLAYDVLLRAQDQDADGALVSCRAILNAARSIGDEPLMIAQLVRVALRALAMNRAERVLAQGQPSDAALQALQQLLEQEEPEPLLLHALRGERGGIDQLLEGIQTGKVPLSGEEMRQIEGSPGNGHEDASTAILGKLLPMTPGFIPSQRTAILRFMNRAIDIAKLPPEQQQRPLDELEATAKDQPVLARLLIPAVSKVADACLRTQAQLRCAIAAVAAERYRRDKGKWPESLEGLRAAGYLRQVPIDLYDGKPLRLRRLDDGLVIYSVGPDGQDNGGKINRNNPIEKGTDLGFRLWDVQKRRQPPAPPKSDSKD
jgi:hypothetical protein